MNSGCQNRIDTMKRAHHFVERVATATVVFVLSQVPWAQTSCPILPVPQPTALVSSPLVTVHFQPRLSRSDFVLRLPNQVDIYVRSTLQPVKVELWTGPTGTQVADAYRCISSNQHSVLTGQNKRFSFMLNSCKDIGNRLEPRVYVANRTNPYSVYAGPFECKTQ